MRVVANDNKPVALWSVPRSISTAFERVFVERDDFEVLHEPFSDAYYYGEDRLSDRYADVEPEAVNNYENVLARVLEPRERRVFVKDMAYHAKGLLGSTFVTTLTLPPGTCSARPIRVRAGRQSPLSDVSASDHPPPPVQRLAAGRQVLLRRADAL